MPFRANHNPAPAPAPPLAPGLTAGLLLAALPHLEKLGLPRPTATAVLETTGVSRARGYELCRHIAASLPAQLRPPGRPRIPVPEPTNTSAISQEILAFLQAHPGAAMVNGTRKTYSDAYRHRVLEIVERHPDLDVTQVAQAVGVPAATLQD